MTTNDNLRGLLADLRKDLAVHWKPRMPNAMQVKLISLQRIDAALAEPDSGEVVASVQITGHLDEIDAPTWEFINSEARKLGPQTGSIDTYNFSRPNGSQPNGGVSALWNGNSLHALAVTVRDAHNRTVCVRVLANKAPAKAEPEVKS